MQRFFRVGRGVHHTTLLSKIRLIILQIVEIMNTDKKTKRSISSGVVSFLLLILFATAAVFAVSYFALPALFSVSYSEYTPAATLTSPTGKTPVPQKPVASSVAHLATPSPMKAIYMSQCVVGTPSFRDSLIKMIDTTDLNSVIIDIRDYTGKISFPTESPGLKDAVSDACGAKDMKSFIAKLHEKNIYVIGRITTFQNPYYTKLHPEQAVQKAGGGVWKDYKGLAFVDVGAKAYWDNVVELGKISYELGFDELNFDYVRFPSDGPMKDAVYSYNVGKSKPVALEEFFKYLHEKLEPTGAVLSADLFGMTATNYDDLNIGQVLERALPYFDHIYPMVYPSHYPKGYNGYSDVNEHSYDIVKIAMDTAVSRTIATSTKIAGLAYTPIMKTVVVPATATTATTTKEVASGLYSKPVYPASKIRPWLQSFDYPVPYTPAMVAAQIKATSDAGIDSWLFWDAGNKYTSLKAVLAE